GFEYQGRRFFVPQKERRPHAKDYGGFRREPPGGKENFDKIRQYPHHQKKPGHHRGTFYL
ncbi:hypothetical protein, partial [Faecalibacterium prausnitzii]|uniref:hypothetical protein n=1 Tax=Faecalibacterium prausnitzii TaxID=853 RepID=UPI001A9825CE